jgi:RNA polymerase sigma-70 factor, ECF subfamily
VTNPTLERARAGEEDAFRELTDPYRRELQVHIYRIVGSVHDAEDLLQETLLAAWRGLDAFEGRASVRASTFNALQTWPLTLLTGNPCQCRP